MPSIARIMIAKRGIVHIMNAKDPTSGAQVVGRIASLLRALSGCMPEGAGTSELARQAGITRPTAHRLLSSLTTQGFVDRDQASGAWLVPLPDDRRPSRVEMIGPSGAVWSSATF